MSKKDQPNAELSSQAEAAEEGGTSLGGRSFLVDEEIRDVIHEGKNAIYVVEN